MVIIGSDSEARFGKNMVKKRDNGSFSVGARNADYFQPARRETIKKRGQKRQLKMINRLEKSENRPGNDFF
jgi:hypothetical protein